MKQKFFYGQMVMKDNQLCKIYRIIQYFDKGECLGFEYYYLPLGTNHHKKSIGYDLLSLN